jgi:hypothetical protein
VPTPSPVRRASLLDRLQLRLSEGRVVDGLWIGTSESQPEVILHRVEQALLLIKAHDPHRYDRLQRDLARVWVRLLPGDRGCFNAELRACELDPRFVLRASVTSAEVAATITHEAAHARLEHCGIRYSEDRRHRIESVCRRQEIAFANRLPDGTAVRKRAEEWLGVPPKFWSNGSLEEQFVEGSVEALRYSGVPGWLLPLVRTVRALMLEVRRRLRAA